MAGLERRTTSTPIAPSVPIAASTLDLRRLADSAKITGAEDYDKMMKMYQDLYANSMGSASNPIHQLAYTPIAPAMQQYQQGGDMTNAMSQLHSATQTGGYSPEGLASIRARGISPIRSIYANAQRGMEQSRTLQGGYSPNFNAASSQMAREMSEKLSAASTAIEADIADRVAKGKATSLSGYAQLASDNDRLRTSVDSNNVNAQNQANQLNASMPLEYGKYNAGQTGMARDQKMQAVEGMRGLYGTTPANSALYGSQSLQQQQLAQQAAAEAARLKAQQQANANSTAASLMGSGRSFG